MSLLVRMSDFPSMPMVAHPSFPQGFVFCPPLCVSEITFPQFQSIATLSPHCRPLLIKAHCHFLSLTPHPVPHFLSNSSGGCQERGQAEGDGSRNRPTGVWVNEWDSTDSLGLRLCFVGRLFVQCFVKNYVDYFLQVQNSMRWLPDHCDSCQDNKKHTSSIVWSHLI